VGKAADPTTDVPLAGPVWHTVPAEEAAGRLRVDLSVGLTEREARRRALRYGANRLREAPRVPWWHVLLRQFRSVVVLLLLAAAAVAFVLHDELEAVSILAVIALNAAIGFVAEFRAGRAMEALQRLGAGEAAVLRGGERRNLPAADLVPGDVILLEEGDSIPADVRLLECAELQVDEASLTGESVPVYKAVEPLPDPDTPLADRTNMAFRGTHVASGNASALVVETGTRTEIGRVGELVTGVQDEQTPLEKRLALMGRRLVVLCLGVAALVAAAGILQGQETALMVEAAIALAIAAIPEGLPAVATIALAVGMQRMARRNALIRRLPAVETLGSVTCVCTDKTGTLTRSEMTVTRVELSGRRIRVGGSGYDPRGKLTEGTQVVNLPAGGPLRALVTACVLCNNASVARSAADHWEAAGDPTEAALVTMAAKAGIDADEARETHEELREFAFSSTTMMMGTVNAGLDTRLRAGQGAALCVKGAPAQVLGRCANFLTDEGARDLDRGARRRLLSRNEELAAEGRRVLAVAFRPVAEPPDGPEDAYRDLTWLGLVGITDPPREEVRRTVDLLTQAGIKTVMITGDQAATAARVAAELHIAPPGAPVLTGRELAGLHSAQLAERLTHVEVFARVSPEQKVTVLSALQERGDICAMLGDGVNDAVALKRADIGVAMGLKGTDVAKETADMVLLDDSFVTVGRAVHQGRIIYANIRKFIHYLFSCNLSEVATMLVASLLGYPLPLLPLQILWLNLITDVFPALALAMEPGEPDAMQRPPRPTEATLLDRATVTSIGGYGFLIMIATVAAFLYGRLARDCTRTPDPAVTLSFLTIGFAQLLHVFNSRKERGSLRRREWVSNPWVLAAAAVTIALQLAAVYAPGLRTVLKTVPPAGRDWLVVGCLSVVPLLVGQSVRRLRAASGGDGAGRGVS
jgi:Ca2+-transporting ATPase